MKPDLWKTFNLSIATTLGVLGIGYVVTTPLTSEPSSELAGPLAPALRAVVLSSELTAPTPAPPSSTTTTPATTVDSATTPPPMAASTDAAASSAAEVATTLISLDAAPASRAPVTFAPDVTDSTPPGTSTTIQSPAAPTSESTSTTSTTSTTTTSTSTTATTVAPPNEPEPCLLRLWNPITGEWECLL